MSKRFLFASPIVFGLAFGCGSSKPPPSLDEIRALTKIPDLMAVQARTFDPLYKKSKGDWTEPDWTMVADSAARLEATSGRVKALSRGMKWDEWAGALNAGSIALGNAAQAKDGTAAKAALGDMRQACKSCHGKFK